MLSSLDLKGRKAMKKVLQTSFGVGPTVYNGDIMDCFEKVTRMRALGLTDP